MNGGEVKEVVEAVRAIYDLSTPNERRLMFSREIEDLKERLSPPSAISLAFQLAQHPLPMVKHLGWNMVEHVIRCKWSVMDGELSAQLKSRLLSEALSGRFSVGQGPDSQIKVAVCRCVACALEADWPQRWPDFLPQLQQVLTAPSSAPSQCEMALLVLERLVEDIHTLGPTGEVDSPRQKELQVGLKGIMRELLSMTTERLRICIAACQQGMIDAYQVAKIGLELLASTFDWVAVTVVEEGIDDLVDILSAYLPQSTQCDVAVEATKCLRSVASRRSGKNREACIVTSMLRDGPISRLVQAISTATSPTASLESYVLLRSLCEFVSALSHHLADVWVHLEGSGTGQPPHNFAHLLSTLAILFTHPATYIRSESAHVLASFSADPFISATDDFQDLLRPLLPRLLAYMNRAQVLEASKPFYATLMMDREEEEREQYRDFLALRERCSKAVRENAQRYGETVFLGMVEDWLQGRFLSSAETLHDDEWEATKRFFSILVSTVDVTDERRATPFVSAFDLALGKIQTLTAENKYPTANLALSITSALFPVFNYRPDRIPSLLEVFKKMLSIENPNNEDSHILSLKRHCITLLLKLISSHPIVLQPYAQLVIGLAVAVNPHLSEMQRANLVSVLGALSNLASTAEEQQVFLTNAIQCNVEYLAGSEFQGAISSAQSFLAYVGLQSEAPRSDAEGLSSVYYRNRLNMKSHLTAIDGVLQQVDGSRFAAPTHPLFALLAPILPSFFHLAQLLNSIYRPGVATTSVHPSYGCRGEVLEMSSIERQAIIRTVLSDTPIGGKEDGSNEDGVNAPPPTGVSIPPPVISPIIRLRTFITEITDLVQTILGSVGSRLQRELYSLEYAQSVGVERMLLEAIADVEHLPDHRLRFWIRRTWSRLISNCPAESLPLVAPLVREYTRHMQTLLIGKWTRELSAREESGDDSPDPTEEDLLNEALLCMISREHSSLLKSLIVAETQVHPKGSSSNVLNLNKQQQPRPVGRDTITELGAQLLGDKDILQNVVAALGQLVGCPDTQSALKCAPTVGVIVTNLASCPIDAQMTGYLLVHAIRSLQLNGAEDMVCSPLLSLIYQIYYNLRPAYPNLLGIIQEVPGQPPDVIQRFDEWMMAAAAKGDLVPERQKRDLVRKVVKTLIGKPTSGLFKRKVTSRRRSS